MARHAAIWLTWVVWSVAAATAAQPQPPAGVAEPVELARPLLAQWTFNEPAGPECRDSGPHGWLAAPVASSSELRRAPGLYANALLLAGRHHLQIAGGPDFKSLEQITLSAWIQPTDVASFKEIFRKEDGDQRVLFSLQNDGRILSLGLNIGSYVECDARIEPSTLLDGGWHHCAASFDGR